jgi:hypothetical protein
MGQAGPAALPVVGSSSGTRRRSGRIGGGGGESDAAAAVAMALGVGGGATPTSAPASASALLARRGGGVGGKAPAAQQVCKPLSKAELAVAEEQRAKASTLWTVKLLFLLFYGSLGSVMPYLPVYYHSLGLPGK